MQKYIEEVYEDIKYQCGEKIGYLQITKFFEGYEEHGADDEVDDDAELEFVYLSSIHLDEAYRNKGYGTKVLKDLAKHYGSFYLIPENARCRHLCERLGEEVPYYKIPEVLQGNADNACLENDDGEIDEDFSGMYIIANDNDN